MRDRRKRDISIYHDGAQFTAPVRGKKRYLLEKAFLDRLTGNWYRADMLPRPVPDPGQDWYWLNDQQLAAYSAFRRKLRKQETAALEARGTRLARLHDAVRVILLSDRVGDQTAGHQHVLRKKQAPMHRYRESGLDNVFLENGYRVHRTPYGEGVSIQNTEGLHRAIGRWLVSTPKPLNGAELRFLRLEMETTQRDLAAIVGTTEQSLRLWEKHRSKPLPGPADRLLRAIYSESIGSNGSVRRMLDRLAELDQTEATQTSFRETRRGWKPRTAPSMETRAGGSR